MPRVAYAPQLVAETVALAAVVGLEAAHVQTGIRRQTIRAWLDRAGKAPADAINAADWQSLGDLARSRVASKLAEGKVSARDAAIIAGIAQRNTTKPEPEPASSEDDAYIAALEEQFGEHVDLALIASIRRLTELGYGNDDPVPADVELAVWEWVAAIPDLPAWQVEYREQDRRRYLEQLEANQLAKQALLTTAERVETEAILAAAEAYLKENAA